MHRYRPAFETYQGEIKRLNARWLEWRPTLIHGIIIGFLFFIAILSIMTVESEFLYFQF